MEHIRVKSSMATKIFRALLGGALLVMISISFAACGGDEDRYGGKKSGAFQWRDNRSFH
jgi:hypothetical protein